jgi:8-oxo-dGTP pyrophosphatase MutT (NUDIX family)
LQVLLTERSADLPDHPGQISFPGGRVEPGDRSLAAAALREAAEEVGLPGTQVSVLGHLAEYETVTGYRVTPVVGWVEPPFALTPDPVEVADVFEVPIRRISCGISGCWARCVATTGRFPMASAISGVRPPPC